MNAKPARTEPDTAMPDTPVQLRTLGDALTISGCPRFLRLMLALGTRLQVGGADVVLPDGRRFSMRAAQDGPIAQMQVHNPRVARKLLLGGGIGFADSYVDGDFDTDDLVAILSMAAINEQVFSNDLLQGQSWRRWLNRLLHRLRPNSPKGSRRNIAHHYDLGNAFYAAWLDASMTYSSALFDRNSNSLEAAQREKYRRLAESIGLGPHHHVLEIGCGWGGFAEFAAREIGCRVTAITVSQEQHDYAVERIAREGLNDRVEIRLQDYRDVTGRFDRIVSIEMLEAVGEKYWPTYFAKLRDLLPPGGQAAIQVITIADRYFEEYRVGTDFIQRYIFPGGLLPSPGVLAREIDSADLQLAEIRGYADDYARTLKEWRQRFREAWPRIEPLGFDERFRRLWEYYLSYCETGFRVGFTDVQQLVVARP